MEKLTRLTTEQRDNLTAYLDGELDEDGTRLIETVLASSTVARNDGESGRSNSARSAVVIVTYPSARCQTRASRRASIR